MMHFLVWYAVIGVGILFLALLFPNPQVPRWVLILFILACGPLAWLFFVWAFLMHWMYKGPEDID